MYLNRIQLKPGPELFDLLKRESSTNAYVVHQLLWSLFPNSGDKKRDFLFREDKAGGLPRFYLVSKDMPVESSAVTVECKPYSPILKKGDRCYFSLVANPVVAKKSEGKKNSVKHDVWNDTKRMEKDNGLTGPDLYKACETAAKNWLINRGENNGFTVSADELLVDGYIQHRFQKRKGGKDIRYSTINYEGILTVNDPQIFLDNALYSGIGPAKAFGCGLMLIKKV